jgi:hypothetical protein
MRCLFKSYRIPTGKRAMMLVFSVMLMNFPYHLLHFIDAAYTPSGAFVHVFNNSALILFGKLCRTSAELLAVQPLHPSLL